MTVELLKIIKEHFELFQKKINEENEQLKKLYEDKQVLNYIKLYRYFYPHVIQTLKLDEDIMDGVLIHHSVNRKDDSIYIDNGTYLVTSTDPKSLGTTSRLIRESDLGYVKNIIENNTNPLIKQSVFHDYISLESGLCCETLLGENNTIIKLPSLIKKESEITSVESDEKIDWIKTNSFYQNFDEEYLSRFNVLRSQFFLKLIKENSESVLEYYRNPKNWNEIDNNIDDYYRKKILHKESVIEKIKNL